MSAQIQRLITPKVEARIRALGDPAVTRSYLMQKHLHYTMMVGVVTLNLFLTSYLQSLREGE